MFRKKLSPTSSGLMNKLLLVLAARLKLVSCLAYSSTLKMEEKYSSEISADL
jgi:hypothetical protein